MANRNRSTTAANLRSGGATTKFLNENGSYSTPAGGSGALTLVEAHQVVANVTSFTFSSLDGDTDGQYLLLLRIVFNGNANTITVRPNAVSTNTTYSRTFTGGSDAGSDWPVGVGLSTGANCVGTMTIFSPKSLNSVSLNRYSVFHWVQDNAGIIQVTGAGKWLETATNITSIQIFSNVASGIGDGSYAALYKHTQT